jgi:hypothetical protein
VSGLDVEVTAKLELLNSGGSMKDRSPRHIAETGLPADGEDVVRTQLLPALTWPTQQVLGLLRRQGSSTA